MSIHAWRIVKAKHAAAAFSGEGARRLGGRWNSRGTSVVYAAGSVSLAILEIFVHMQRRDLSGRYVQFAVEFDQSLVTVVDPAALPSDWRSSPPTQTTQQIGDAWANAGLSAVFRVPSAIVPSEWIYVLNPGHPDFARIDISPSEPVAFDGRLINE